MKILITGADGMVARSAAGLYSRLGDDVTAASKRDLDITRRDAAIRFVGEGGFDAVINCAAYTDVDGAESNQELCNAVNAKGVGYLAEACRASGARFVTISTDYVFDGSKGSAYSERDSPSPQGVYGKAKLEGEHLAAEAYPESVIVRSGWIFGPGGTNFLSAMPRLLSNGKRIKAIEDSYGTPTFSADLARRLRELAESVGSGIFHVVNSGKGTSYLGFALQVCEAGGFDPELVEAVSSKDLKRPAPRPSDSRLSTVRAGSLDPLPKWQDAVSRFVDSS